MGSSIKNKNCWQWKGPTLTQVHFVDSTLLSSFKTKNDVNPNRIEVYDLVCNDGLT